MTNIFTVIGTLKSNIIFQVLSYQHSYSLVPWNNSSHTCDTKLHWSFPPPYHIHMVSSSLKPSFGSAKIQWVSPKGDGEEHDKGFTSALFLLSSNLLSSTEIVPSKMEYQGTSSLLYYQKNCKISTMSNPLKPVSFTLLFGSLSDSLSTSMPLAFTRTQEEFIVIHVFLSNGSMFWAPGRQQDLEKKYTGQFRTSSCILHVQNMVHVSTVSLLSSSSCRVMLAAVLRHSRYCHTAAALPLPCNRDSGPLQEHQGFQSRGRNQGEHEGGFEGGQLMTMPAKVIYDKERGLA